MTNVVFYHLTRRGLDETVEGLLMRAVGQGWRVMVRCPDVGLVARLDEKLWLGAEDGFLPHGVQGGAFDRDQPVLLGPGPMTNSAQALMLLAGAEVAQGEAAGLERVWVVFDGADAAAVADARRRWPVYKAWGLDVQYWSDAPGGGAAPTGA